MNPETLLLIGGTMALMMAVASFVLTQKHAWKAILLLVVFFGALNIGIFIWAEILQGWSARRLVLFWLAAVLPPLLGVGIGAIVGVLVNWRISNIRPTYPGAKRSRKMAPKPTKEKSKRKKPLPKPRIID